MLLKWIADLKDKADIKAAQRGPDEPETPEELQLQEKLERLLIASFKYMGVTELKQVHTAAAATEALALAPLHVYWFAMVSRAVSGWQVNRPPGCC
jgi:hypothetical protein